MCVWNLRIERIFWANYHFSMTFLKNFREFWIFENFIFWHFLALLGDILRSNIRYFKKQISMLKPPMSGNFCYFPEWFAFIDRNATCMNIQNESMKGCTTYVSFFKVGRRADKTAKNVLYFECLRRIFDANFPGLKPYFLNPSDHIFEKPIFVSNKLMLC